MAWYLFWRGSHILLALCLDDDCRLKLPSSHNSHCHASTFCMVVVSLPVFPAWLLANQHFIKSNTSDRIKDHCLTVVMIVSDPIISLCLFVFNPLETLLILKWCTKSKTKSIHIQKNWTWRDVSVVKSTWLFF